MARTTLNVVMITFLSLAPISYSLSLVPGMRGGDFSHQEFESLVLSLKDGKPVSQDTRDRVLRFINPLNLSSLDSTLLLAALSPNETISTCSSICFLALSARQLGFFSPRFVWWALLLIVAPLAQHIYISGAHHLSAAILWRGTPAMTASLQAERNPHWEPWSVHPRIWVNQLGPILGGSFAGYMLNGLFGGSKLIFHVYPAFSSAFPNYAFAIAVSSSTVLFVERVVASILIRLGVNVTISIIDECLVAGTSVVLGIVVFRNSFDVVAAVTLAAVSASAINRHMKGRLFGWILE